MAGLMAAVAIMMIFSAVAFQEWSQLLRRDNEAEMMFRAQDLVRSIQRYRKDHGGQGPMKLEDLMEVGPKRQYYVRKLWEDPLVKDGKWGLLHMGPGGQVFDPNAETEPGGGLGGLGQPLGSGRRSRDGKGRSSGSRLGQLGNQGGLGGNQSGARAGQLGGLANSGAFGGNESNGLPIAGVKSLCEDKPFRIYKGFEEYKDWLFSYLDLEQQTPGNNPNGPPGARQIPGRPGNTPGNGPGNAPRNGPGNGLGNGPGDAGFQQGKPKPTPQPTGNLTPRRRNN